jgi:hypothetical protein
MKQIRIVWVKCIEFLNVKSAGTYSYRSALYSKLASEFYTHIRQGYFWAYE